MQIMKSASQVKTRNFAYTTQNVKVFVQIHREQIDF